MGNITLVPPVAATSAVAGTFSTAFTTLQTVINGNIDNTNINAAAAIDYSKISVPAGAITQAKVTFDAWQAFTPAWTSSGSAPSVGNGTITGRYVQLGKTVLFNLSLVFGSTTSAGTGTWRFSLPVTSVASALINANARAVDAGVANYMGEVFTLTTTTVEPFTINAATGTMTQWTNTSPFTWGNTDSCTLQGMFEAA